MRALFVAQYYLAWCRKASPRPRFGRRRFPRSPAHPPCTRCRRQRARPPVAHDPTARAAPREAAQRFRVDAVHGAHLAGGQRQAFGLHECRPLAAAVTTAVGHEDARLAGLIDSRFVHSLRRARRGRVAGRPRTSRPLHGGLGDSAVPELVHRGMQRRRQLVVELHAAQRHQRTCQHHVVGRERAPVGVHQRTVGVLLHPDEVLAVADDADETGGHPFRYTAEPARNTV